MQVGVALGSEPVNARFGISSVKYQNVTYYVGECTGGKWRSGWRVGESPTQYQKASTKVVTLQNMEQFSIGQVTANLRELDPSTLTLQVSSSFALEDSPITISGQILPEVANENVTIQAQINNRVWIT